MKIETITKQKMENYRITKENTIKKKNKNNIHHILYK